MLRNIFENNCIFSCKLAEFFVSLQVEFNFQKDKKLVPI